MPESSDMDEAWRTFLSTRAQSARETLIVNYLPLVTRVARKLGRRLPARVDRDDLTSWGVLGLIDALDRFDPELGKFETFAAPRIRGAILDEIRDLDWVPRSVRARDRRVREATIELQAQHGRSVTLVEVAQHLGVDAQLIDRSDEQWHSLDEPDRDGLLASELHGDHSASVESLISVGDVRRRACAAIVGLDDRSRQLIALYYLGGCTLGDVGATFGVTESRVCQLQGSALAGFGSAFVLQ